VRQDSPSLQVAESLITGSIKQMRLYTINGIELHDTDSVDMLKDSDYLYFSFSKRLLLLTVLLAEPFDFSVCMEFLELKGKLGEGGFGQVYLAYDTLNKRQCAVKILNSNDHPLTPHMMNKEIEALAKLKHKHIVKMYNSFPLPKKHQVIVVMEYLEGGELYTYW
jgi:serine/threonine protein kinase